MDGCMDLQLRPHLRQGESPKLGEGVTCLQTLPSDLHRVRLNPLGLSFMIESLSLSPSPYLLPEPRLHACQADALPTPLHP